MADFLQQAEQQGLIDVFVVTLTRHEWLSVPQNRSGHPKSDKERDAVLDEVVTTVSHWRRLDGHRPGWKEETINTDMADCILQVRFSVVLHYCKEKDLGCQLIDLHSIDTSPN